MKIRLHIDRIVVDGAPLTRREREQLASALQRDLTGLLHHKLSGGAAAADQRQPTSPLSSAIAGQVLASLPVARLAGRPKGSR